MSVTEHTVQTASREANKLDMVAAVADGEKFANTGVEKILIQNDNVASVTVTVQTPATADELAIADREIVIPAGEIHYLGPWPTKWYNDANGFVNFACSPYADVSLGVIK